MRRPHPSDPLHVWPRRRRQPLACLCLVTLVVTHCACSTVVSSKTVRGELLERKIVQTEQRGPVQIGIQRIGATDIQVKQTGKRCQDIESTYARFEEEEVEGPFWFPIGVGIVGGVAGGGLVAGFTQTRDESMQLLLLALGLTLAIGPHALFAALEVPYVITETRTEPREPEVAMTTRCEDIKLQGNGVPWILSLGGNSVRGQTDGAGRARLKDAMEQLLLQGASSLDWPKLAQEGPEYILSFDGPKFTLRGGPAEVPESAWKAAAAVYRGRLSAVSRVRWDTCLSVVSAPRALFQCVPQPSRLPGIEAISGALSADEAAGYLALHEFRGQKGQRFALRLLPRPSWAIQVLELEHERVIAETYATGTDPMELSGTFPQTGSYMIVISADTAGSFEALLALGGK